MWGRRGQRTTAALSRNWKLISKSKTTTTTTTTATTTKPQYKNVSTSLAEWGRKPPVFLFAPSTALGRIQTAVLSSYPANRVGVEVGVVVGWGGMSSVLSPVTPFKDDRLQNPELGQPLRVKRSSFTNKHTKTTKT